MLLMRVLAKITHQFGGATSVSLVHASDLQAWPWDTNLQATVSRAEPFASPVSAGSMRAPSKHMGIVMGNAADSLTEGVVVGGGASNHTTSSALQDSPTTHTRVR